MLEESLKNIIRDLYNIEVTSVEFTHPDLSAHGDLSTNLAFTVAKIVKQKPYEIARTVCYELENIGLVAKLTQENVQIFEKLEALQPGFINAHYTVEWLKLLPKMYSKNGMCYGMPFIYTNSKIIVEYTDPNPFKIFHIGHLMTNTIGESLARIYKKLGADVRRANYQGDVGMHVSKSIWGAVKNLEESGLTIADLELETLDIRVDFLGKSYSRGAQAFKENDIAQKEIKALNSLIFSIAQDYNYKEKGQKKVLDYSKLFDVSALPFDKKLVETLYLAGRRWSLDYFETLYKRLGTKFDFYYFESNVAEQGYTFVMDNLKNGIFEKDADSVIYRGEREGLHTRVFINSFGLPVYEAKDLGLAFVKYSDFKYDKSIIVTANEINSYFEVVLNAMSKINPELAAKTTHIGHGLMKLKEGKMSSRTGNIVGGDALLNDLKDEVIKKMKESSTSSVPQGEISDTADKIAVASIKYQILKSGIGNDIVYDRDSILSLSGNTGSYILYTYSRVASLKRLYNSEDYIDTTCDDVELNPVERELLRHLTRFSDTVVLSAQRLSPNLIAAHIYQLCQIYNKYYSETPIIKSDDALLKRYRVLLSHVVGLQIEEGLDLLGINVVDRM